MLSPGQSKKSTKGQHLINRKTACIVKFVASLTNSQNFMSLEVKLGAYQLGTQMLKAHI